MPLAKSSSACELVETLGTWQLGRAITDELRVDGRAASRMHSLGIKNTNDQVIGHRVDCTLALDARVEVRARPQGLEKRGGERKKEEGWEDGEGDERRKSEEEEVHGGRGGSLEDRVDRRESGACSLSRTAPCGGATL